MCKLSSHSVVYPMYNILFHLRTQVTGRSVTTTPAQLSRPLKPPRIPSKFSTTLYLGHLAVQQLLLSSDGLCLYVSSLYLCFFPLEFNSLVI